MSESPPDLDTERIASRVAELLRDDLQPAKLLTTREVAGWLGLEPETVRAMADDLGAWRLPSPSGQGRLRFDRDEIERRLRPEPAHPSTTTSKRSSGPSSDVELLPIHD